MRLNYGPKFLASKRSLCTHLFLAESQVVSGMWWTFIRVSIRLIKASRKARDLMDQGHLNRRLRQLLEPGKCG